MPMSIPSEMSRLNENVFLRCLKYKLAYNVKLKYTMYYFAKIRKPVSDTNKL